MKSNYGMMRYSLHKKIKLSVKTIYAFAAVKRKTYGIICMRLTGECSKPTICKILPAIN